MSLSVVSLHFTIKILIVRYRSLISSTNSKLSLYIVCTSRLPPLSKGTAQPNHHQIGVTRKTKNKIRTTFQLIKKRDVNIETARKCCRFFKIDLNLLLLAFHHTAYTRTQTSNHNMRLCEGEREENVLQMKWMVCVWSNDRYNFSHHRMWGMHIRSSIRSLHTVQKPKTVIKSWF